jgi:preprotein translocase subunit SecA
MLNKLVARIVGSRNQRVLKQAQKLANQVNAWETEIAKLSDTDLQARTPALKQRLQKGASLESILPEAFAVCREASKRVMRMRHFDVQLIGGVVLNQGKIAEMRTGEGKTLVGTLAAYLNALTGKGVHIITVNDYLARRDAMWMKPLYEFLGLTVGTILSGQDQEEKKAAYACDITYGTNNEFGFDYLRDNMAFTLQDKVQRGLNFAIVDEVDSILIDEARTPLIISGAAEDSSEMYQAIDKIVPRLKRKKGEEDSGDYEVDEKTKQVHLSEEGHLHLEKLLADAGLMKDSTNLYDLANLSLMHHVNAALRAHACFQKNVDYIIQKGEVVIVDEHTGRTMPGRRWSEGLHQAVEAKENVKIQNENVTLASITFQNYFRLYHKLGGMTGTADTEAYEFQQIYGLEVVVIPTNKTPRREDTPDQIYLTFREKFNAIIADVKERSAKGQPVLVGTASIETSEYLSDLLNKEKLAHQVLNAKFHEKEADIIAQAGKPGAVTIATNMAGRGTDIILGGNVKAAIANLKEPSEAQIKELENQWQQDHDAVLAAGGLHIVGSERHESRRIDNQLRGRSGRQGDPGSSRFYLSLEDNLMRIFASGRIGSLMKKLGMKEGESIEHVWVTKAVENAQRKVEGHNFDIRKQLLEYDDVANDQRRVIYTQRDQLLASTDISSTIHNVRQGAIEKVINDYIPPNSLEEQWDVVGLEKQLQDDFHINLPLREWLKADDHLNEDGLRRRITEVINDTYITKEKQVGAPVMRHFEKSMMLQSLDNHWREHLAAMDHLRQGIGWRGYAQKNPKQEYKRESFLMFNDMLEGIKHEVASMLSKAQFVAQEDIKVMEQQHQSITQTNNLKFQHSDISGLDLSNEQIPQAIAPPTNEALVSVVHGERKQGRNDLCACGSGKKYKHCHGKV